MLALSQRLALACASPVDPATPTEPAARPSEPLPPEGSSAAAADEPSGFLGSTLAELRKVVWPSRQQLFSESVAVVLMVGLSAAAIAAIDRFYTWVSTQVFR